MTLKSVQKAQTKEQNTGFKIKTSLKAGECCWDAYQTALNTQNEKDWTTFRNCCSGDPKCTYNM